MELTKLIKLLHEEIKRTETMTEFCTENHNEEGKSAWMSRGNALRDFAVKIVENID